MHTRNHNRQLHTSRNQITAVLFLTMTSSLFLCLAGNSAQAALLDTAIAQWQFAEYETLGTGVAGTGTTTATQNNTGTLNDVRDLNGNQSWMTRYFNGSANGATVGNTISGSRCKRSTPT